MLFLSSYYEILVAQMPLRFLVQICFPLSLGSVSEALRVRHVQGHSCDGSQKVGVVRTCFAMMRDCIVELSLHKYKLSTIQLYSLCMYMTQHW